MNAFLFCQLFNLISDINIEKLKNNSTTKLEGCKTALNVDTSWSECCSLLIPPVTPPVNVLTMAPTRCNRTSSSRAGSGKGKTPDMCKEVRTLGCADKFGMEVAEMAIDYVKYRQGGVDNRPKDVRPDGKQLFRESAVVMRRQGMLLNISRL